MLLLSTCSPKSTRLVIIFVALLVVLVQLMLISIACSLLRVENVPLRWLYHTLLLLLLNYAVLVLRGDKPTHHLIGLLGPLKIRLSSFLRWKLTGVLSRTIFHRLIVRFLEDFLAVVNLIKEKRSLATIFMFDWWGRIQKVDYILFWEDCRLGGFSSSKNNRATGFVIRLDILRLSKSEHHRVVLLHWDIVEMYICLVEMRHDLLISITNLVTHLARKPHGEATSSRIRLLSLLQLWHQLEHKSVIQLKFIHIGSIGINEGLIHCDHQWAWILHERATQWIIESVLACHWTRVLNCALLIFLPVDLI